MNFIKFSSSPPGRFKGIIKFIKKVSNSSSKKRSNSSKKRSNSSKFPEFGQKPPKN